MEKYYLAHHGIKGQKWGVKNGPPYPLDAKGQLKRVKSLNDELNKWKYGVVVDGKVITDPSKVDWSRYKTHPIGVMKKYHAGILLIISIIYSKIMDIQTNRICLLCKEAIIQTIS